MKHAWSSRRRVGKANPCPQVQIGHQPRSLRTSVDALQGFPIFHTLAPGVSGWPPGGQRDSQRVVRWEVAGGLPMPPVERNP